MKKERGVRQNGRLSEEQKVILTDAGIFAAKLWVDGIKDIVLGVACIGAALLDVLRGRGPQGFLFYRMMRWSKRVDEMIDLYGVADLPEPLAEPSTTGNDGTSAAPPASAQAGQTEGRTQEQKR